MTRAETLPIFIKSLTGNNRQIANFTPDLFIKNMLNLILFGPPGCGKGTQAQLLIDAYKLLHLSTGDLLRNEIKESTPLGIEAKKYIDKGELVPDEVVIGMISGKLDEYAGKVKGFIFDGFPRTKAQAEALDKLLKFKQTSISRVISLEVPEEEVVRRILNRGQTSGRSDDNDPEIIRKRFNVYQKETTAVADHYAESGKFSAVEGLGTIEEVFGRLKKVIDGLE
jgi:adenylate kinase